MSSFKLGGELSRNMIWACFACQNAMTDETRNKPIIDTDTMRSAFHQQALGFTHMDSEMKLTKNYGILFYKVRKAVIQNILVRNFPKFVKALNMTHQVYKNASHGQKIWIKVGRNERRIALKLI
jgi:hypothetical protein